MTDVLCFGDSNTWGYNPKDGSRFPWGVRWTSILQEQCRDQGVHIIEEGLCGRTTIFEDPLRQGRSGVDLFPTILETHDAPEQIILMLGTNDCKRVFSASADVIGKGICRLLDQAKRFAPSSKILLISPIFLGERVWEEGFDQEFSKESVEVSKKLGDVYEKIAKQYGIDFLRASDYVQSSEEDQEHMNANSHQLLAGVIAKKLFHGTLQVEG